MSEPLVLLTRKGDVAHITLNRPARHNSLVPQLIDALLVALANVASMPPRVVVLAGAGRSFSTGGDISAFHATPRAERRAYAARLVGGLNTAILALIDLPCPVVARVQGPVTGGSLGFLLGSDLVVMAREAFIAPYYVDVGFSPDGGWTAMLPERIGPARAAEIQMLNGHISAEKAHALGLATLVVEGGDLDAEVDAMIDLLLTKSSASLVLTKKLLWPEGRRQRVAEGLARELASFVDRIALPEAEAGMARFLENRFRSLERRA